MNKKPAIDTHAGTLRELLDELYREHLRMQPSEDLREFLTHKPETDNARRIHAMTADELAMRDREDADVRGE